MWQRWLWEKYHLGAYRHEFEKDGIPGIGGDADESNFGLHQLLGLPLHENIMDQFGGKKGFQEKMAAFRKQTGDKNSKFFKESWTVESVPENYVKTNADIESIMAQHLNPKRVIGRIPTEHDVFMASLNGNRLNVVLPQIDAVCRFLIDSAVSKEPKP